MSARPAAACLILAALTAPARAGKFLDNMHKAQTRGLPEERREYYDRAIKIWEPADGQTLLGQAHFGRGQALAELWRFAEAEPDLTKALDLDPGNAKAHLLRGRALLKLGKANEAAADLLEYAGRNPADVGGLALLGEAQLKAGRGDAAMNACKLAQQAEAEHAAGWLCEGRVWMGRREWSKGEEALTAADRKADHRLPEALADRAVCRVALGRHEQALGDYTAAVPLLEAALQDAQRRPAPDGEHAERRLAAAKGHYARGRVLEFMIKPVEASADFTQACRLGYEPACERADALALKASPPKAAPKRPAAPLQPVEPAPPPKKRKDTPYENDGGTRIYGG